MVGPDDVFGLDAIEMRALVFDDAIVAILDRPLVGDRDDRIRMDAGATGVAAIAWTTGLLGVMPKRLPDPSVPGSTLKSLAFRVARSAPSTMMRRGRVMKRPTSRAAENSVR